MTLPWATEDSSQRHVDWRCQNAAKGFCNASDFNAPPSARRKFSCVYKHISTDRLTRIQCLASHPTPAAYVSARVWWRFARSGPSSPNIWQVRRARLPNMAAPSSRGAVRRTWRPDGELRSVKVQCSIPCSQDAPAFGNKQRMSNRPSRTR